MLYHPRWPHAVKAEDDLREVHRYAGTFLVSHINAAFRASPRLRPSTPSNPARFSAFTAARTRQVYGANQVLRSTLAAPPQGQRSSQLHSGAGQAFGFLRIPVEISLPYLRSIALGGGSVVKAGANGTQPEISLGPESMAPFLAGLLWPERRRAHSY